MDPASLLALLSLISMIVKFLGPPIGRIVEARIEAFRAKNPKSPVGEGLSTIAEVFRVLVEVYEQMNWGTMTKEEISAAKRNGVIKDGIAQVLVRGLWIDENQARYELEGAVMARNVLLKGRKAPTIALVNAAVEETSKLWARPPDA